MHRINSNSPPTCQSYTQKRWKEDIPDVPLKTAETAAATAADADVPDATANLVGNRRL